MLKDSARPLVVNLFKLLSPWIKMITQNFRCIECFSFFAKQFILPVSFEWIHNVVVMNCTFFVCLSIAFFWHVNSQMLQQRNYEYEANDFRTAWIGCGLVESNNFNFLIFFFHVPCSTCSQNAILILCNIVLIEKKNQMKKIQIEISRYQQLKLPFEIRLQNMCKYM